MILFLTYHRVCDDDTLVEKRDFYTVTRSALAQHLSELEKTGNPPLDPETLPGNSVSVRKCYLSFDDGTEDHFNTVLPLLSDAGRRAVFFVPTAKLDRPGYVTRAQLKQIADAGHTIGCHSHEHARMDTMSAGELRRQFMESMNILREVTGVMPWIFAPPGGFINRAVRAAALESGLRVIRTMRWGYNRDVELTALETVPINRHTDARKFQRILECRESRFLYAGKEAAKALLPSRSYERLRKLVFKATHHH